MIAKSPDGFDIGPLPASTSSVLDLIGADRRDKPADGPLTLLDATAKAAYPRRLGDLRAELAEAERCHDLGREEQAREEIEAPMQQLAGALGLGGRDRPPGPLRHRHRAAHALGHRFERRQEPVAEPL